MLGDYRYYKEGRSLILNVFEPAAVADASHFTTLRLLNYLYQRHREGVDGGFLRLADVFSVFEEYSGTDDDVRRALLRLIEVDRQLVELDTRRTDAMDGAALVRITSSGMYYLRYLARAFAYLDLVWQDTPIADIERAAELRKQMHAIDTEARFVRVELFLDYLDGQEAREAEGRLLAPTEGTFWGPFIPGIRRQFELEREEIRRRLKNASTKWKSGAYKATPATTGGKKGRGRTVRERKRYGRRGGRRRPPPKS
jgi:hypothetical protein